MERPITRLEFERDGHLGNTVAGVRVECGADCWNDWHCIRQAFQRSDVAEVLRLAVPLTGLYRGVTVRLADGSVVDRRVN